MVAAWRLTDNQFAALVSFTFNLGARNLNKLLKNGLAAVPDRIPLFDHAGGQAPARPNPLLGRRAHRVLDTLTPDCNEPTGGGEDDRARLGSKLETIAPNDVARYNPLELLTASLTPNEDKHHGF